jgi:hypothetical protein
METQSEKFILSLEKAKKSLQMADHLTYMTYPIVREDKLLLKILDELNSSLLNTINAILQYEYTYKRIQLYRDAKENFHTFEELTEKYKINQEQLSKIKEIMSLLEKHKKSPFEFVKDNKVVIMSDSLKTDTLTLEKIKSFLIEVKDVLRKVSLVIKPA